MVSVFKNNFLERNKAVAIAGEVKHQAWVALTPRYEMEDEQGGALMPEVFVEAFLSGLEGFRNQTNDNIVFCGRTCAGRNLAVSVYSNTKFAQR